MQINASRAIQFGRVESNLSADFELSPLANRSYRDAGVMLQPFLVAHGEKSVSLRFCEPSRFCRKAVEEGACNREEPNNRSWTTGRTCLAGSKPGEFCGNASPYSSYATETVYIHIFRSESATRTSTRMKISRHR